MPAIQKLSTIAFRWDSIGIFLHTRPRHHKKTEQQKTASRNKMLIKLYCMDENSDHVFRGFTFPPPL